VCCDAHILKILIVQAFALATFAALAHVCLREDAPTEDNRPNAHTNPVLDHKHRQF